MQPKLFFIVVLIFFNCMVATSQSIFDFRYNFNLPTDSITYHAFMLKNIDGSGLIRLRFETTNNQDILVEMDVDEQYAIDEAGLEDTSTLIVRGINPRLLIGDKTNYPLPIFIFKYNPANDFFEPFGITDSEKKIEMPSSTSFTWQFIEGAALNKNFISQYFSEDEDLYLIFFKPLTRGLSPLEKNTRLHLLVVADTLDETIGTSCAKDLIRAVQTFKALTDYLGIKYLSTIICGKQYSKKNVQLAIANLRPSSNDIVVFYYTGHGFRLPERPRPFPNMKLKNFKTDIRNFRDSTAWRKKSRQDNITYSLNIEDIFNSIRKKRARFNLVISDCCNNDIFGTNAKGTKPGKTKGSGVEWNEDNIRTLFLNKNPMSILATAAESGQKATSNDNFGGFFSYFFKQSMETYCSKLKTVPTWDQILKDTKLQTVNKANHTYCDKPYIPENICQQSPTYRIIFGR